MRAPVLAYRRVYRDAIAGLQEGLKRNATTMRRFGEPYLHDQSYTHRPGAYVILRRGDRLLLTIQEGFDGLPPELQLPGGGVDPGESPIPAMHREVIEETGWKMRLECKLGAYRRFTYMPEYELWAEKVCHIYLGTPTFRIGDPTEAGHVPIWLPIDLAIEELTNSGDRAFTAALFDSRRMPF